MRYGLGVVLPPYTLARKLANTCLMSYTQEEEFMPNQNNYYSYFSSPTWEDYVVFGDIPSDGTAWATLINEIYGHAHIENQLRFDF